MSIAQSPFLSSYEIGKCPGRRWKATVLGPPSGRASAPACLTLMSTQQSEPHSVMAPALLFSPTPVSGFLGKSRPG